MSSSTLFLTFIILGVTGNEEDDYLASTYPFLSRLTGVWTHFVQPSIGISDALIVTFFMFYTVRQLFTTRRVMKEREASYTNTIQKLQDEKAHLEKKLASLKIEHKLAKKEKKSEHKEDKKEKKHIKSIKEENEKLKKLVEGQKSTREELKQAQAKLKAQQNAIAKLDDLKAKNNEVDSKSKAKIQELGEEIKNLKSHAKVLEKQASEALETQKKILKDNEKLLKEKQSLLSEHEKLASNHTKEIFEFKLQLKDKDTERAKEVKNISDKLHEKESHFLQQSSTYEQQLKCLQSTHENEKKELKALQERYSNLEKKLEKTNQLRESLQVDLKTTKAVHKFESRQHEESKERWLKEEDRLHEEISRLRSERNFGWDSLEGKDPRRRGIGYRNNNREGEAGEGHPTKGSEERSAGRGGGRLLRKTLHHHPRQGRLEKRRSSEAILMGLGPRTISCNDSLTLAAASSCSFASSSSPSAPLSARGASTYALNQTPEGTVVSVDDSPTPALLNSLREGLSSAKKQREADEIIAQLGWADET